MNGNDELKWMEKLKDLSILGAGEAAVGTGEAAEAVRSSLVYELATGLGCDEERASEILDRQLELLELLELLKQMAVRDSA